jgi:Zn-finger nucleic acid-binding protein
MEIEELEIVHLELKYCERCGGLWLRLQGSGDVYCDSCAKQVAGLPVRRSRTTHNPVANGVVLKSADDRGQARAVPSAEGGNA